MNKDTTFGRLIGILFITMFVCLALYMLPDTILGYKIKKVDLLSDLRIKDDSVSIDQLKRKLAIADSLLTDSINKARLALSAETDSFSIALRDSLYKAMQSSWSAADSQGVRLEDFSLGHVGLKRFYAALKNAQERRGQVRIAFMGDSFIEGDIMVADFRNAMQQKFGGRGVGFVPIASSVSQYRPTVEHHFGGWNTFSLLTDKSKKYTLPGMVFEAQEGANANFRTVNRYATLREVSALKLVYEQNANSQVQLVSNSSADTAYQDLPATNTVTQRTWTGHFTNASFRFNRTEGLRVLGVSMEDTTGVVVDNYSLRGNSGLILEQMDPSRCEALNAIRRYDLIVLQYGLNVVSDEMLHYGWYRQRMVQVIKHVQRCFPNADILLLGVSDRSRQEEGTFKTMPAVLALLHAQRQIAQQAGVCFWNVFGAMGGENSMVRYVDNNWASKDYTHLSFRGGKEIGMSLFKAVLIEKQFYDEAEKALR